MQQSTEQIWQLIQQLCQMFQSMSYTLEEYGNIVLTVLNKYYLKLFRRYKGLSSLPSSKLTTIDLVAKKTGTRVSAQWSNDEVVHQILVDLLNCETSDDAGVLLQKVLSYWDWD
jgi:hypothetical protein